MVNNSEASCLICIRDFNDINYPEFINGFLAEMPSLRKIIYLDDGKSPRDGNLDELLAAPVYPAVMEDLEKEEKGNADNFIIYTSGTTGKPKGVVLKQKNILAMIRPWRRNIGIDEDGRVLCMLPLNHVGGGTILALTTLACGSELVLMDIFNPQKMIELLQSEKISVFGGAPTVFELTFSMIPDKSGPCRYRRPAE